MKNIPLQIFLRNYTLTDFNQNIFIIFSTSSKPKTQSKEKIAPLLIKEHILTDCIHEIYTLKDI